VFPNEFLKQFNGIIGFGKSHLTAIMAFHLCLLPAAFARNLKFDMPWFSH
jgi:hypothetical protein